MDPLSYKVLPKQEKYNIKNKKILPKNLKSYIILKNSNKILFMKKNPGGNIKSIQVDTISGEYYITIPEWVINELSWYEDTEINFLVEGDEIILSEHKL